MAEFKYTVLLAEDDISIREGIRDVIEWDDLGYRLTSEAGNGKEALELYEKLSPDVVITDIHMPRLDGLSLTSAIKDRSADAKVIILTGFDEFEYARTALKLNVTDYLLKPVSPRELTELLLKVKKEMDLRAAEHRAATNLDSESLFRRMAMLKIISGITDENLTSSLMKNDELVAGALWFRVMVYDYDNAYRSINPDSYRTRFRNLNPDEIHGELIPDNSGMLIEILLSDRIGALDFDLDTLVRKKRLSIAGDPQLTVSAGIGRVAEDIADIRVSYESARTSLSHRYVRGGGLNHDSASTGENKKHQEPILQFLKSIESGSVDEWNERLSAIIEELKHNDASQEQSLEIMTLAVSAMVNALKKKASDFDVKGRQMSLLVKNARSYKTIDALQVWLTSLIGELTENIKKQRLDSLFTIVEAVKKYIEDNYMRSLLALEDLCSHLGVSRSTLSRIFRNYLDTTFSSYLREVRIGAAKKIIRQTDMRNKEIAFRVGFRSPHYFSHVFTKHVGYSPSEYRHKFENAEMGTEKMS